MKRTSAFLGLCFNFILSLFLCGSIPHEALAGRGEGRNLTSEDNEGLTSEEDLVKSESKVVSARQASSRLVFLQTDLGSIRGSLEYSEVPTFPPTPGRHYYAFRGIPYAKPPIGNLRWKAPEPAERWTEELDATRHRSFCPQYDYDRNEVVGDENCLFLNIYTPFLPGQGVAPLAVLVFLHGGAYIRGASASYGAHKIMTENVVVVTLNYRLGALGFLSTGDSELPGNYGLLDQIAALRWVTKHIAQFGGDPNRITLGGHSAGASMAHLLLLSPQAHGLFDRVLMMSGAGNCLWSVAQDPWDSATKIASKLDCSTTFSSSLASCMRDKRMADIVKAQTDMHRYVFWPFAFRPVVDAGLRDDPVLPEDVESLMRKPLSTPTPVLTGLTTHEGLLFAITVILFSENPSSANNVFEDAAEYVLSSLWTNESSVASVTDALMSFYFSSHARESTDVFLDELTEALTDQLFTSCVWDAASSLAVSSRAPVFTYVMSYHSPTSPAWGGALYDRVRSLGMRTHNLESSVSHGDDLCLLFPIGLTQLESSEADLYISSLITTLWMNFVRTGSPHLGPTGPFSWTPLLPGDRTGYYNISLVPSMSSKPFRGKERNLWRQTLAVVEELDVFKDYFIATWVLLALILIFLIILIVAIVFIVRARRSKTYSSGIPRLQ
ncbi:esterase E4-like [Oratosquilla oratoria]|uniref:esterase E4-like n=1 Tax=Oratosquilla oratoria TaxID=337810 RepID=UPI003F774446